MTHRFEVRVYYEDTDLAGIVYYANYLKFIERARSEFIRARGVDQGALKRDKDMVFAVRHIEADYLTPARFDDLLIVTTRVSRLGGARLIMAQDIRRGTTAVFSASVTLACLTSGGRPGRIPADIRRKLIDSPE